MARASPMVLDYGSLNKKWTGDTTVSHGTLSFLACSVGTVLMGVVCCLVDRQEHYRDLSPDSCGQCIICFTLSGHAKDSHILKSCFVFYIPSLTRPYERGGRASSPACKLHVDCLSCLTCPSRAQTILVRLICRIARFDDVGSNQEHENS